MTPEQTTPKADLEKYIREQGKKYGRPQQEIDKVVDVILSLKFINSREAVDAFMEASKP